VKNINNSIHEMAAEGWLRKPGESKLNFFKAFGHKNLRVIKISLIPDGDMLRLVHPKYEHHCRTSYFISSEGEQRMTLNKVYLESVIRSLKNSELWERVVNRDFLVVNGDNKKLNKLVAKKMLMEMIS